MAKLSATPLVIVLKAVNKQPEHLENNTLISLSKVKKIITMTKGHIQVEKARNHGAEQQEGYKNISSPSLEN